MEVDNCNFDRGRALNGGSIFIFGFSSVTIKDSHILNSYAEQEGGSINAKDFKQLKLKNVKLWNSKSRGVGAVLRINTLQKDFHLDNVHISSFSGNSALYIETTKVDATSLVIEKNQNNDNWGGGGIYCTNCHKFKIRSSTFSNL